MAGKFVSLRAGTRLFFDRVLVPYFKKRRPLWAVLGCSPMFVAAVGAFGISYLHIVALFGRMGFATFVARLHAAVHGAVSEVEAAGALADIASSQRWCNL